MLDLDAFSVDISLGLEPIPIPVEGLTSTELLDLRQSFQEYTPDSILPDGSSIDTKALTLRDKANTIPGRRVSLVSDGTPGHQEPGSESEDEDVYDDVEGCECEGSTSCSVDAGACDCVHNFGHFYKLQVTGLRTLELDALPSRLPLVECGLACNCAPSCLNRVTQDGVRSHLLVRRARADLGLGCFLSPSSSPLPRGIFIALYAGEYLSTLQARQRWKEHKRDNYTLSLRLPGQTIHIDPRTKGNVGRFLNHSCEPNCVVLVVHRCGGEPRAAIFTNTAVQPGDELTFDYGNASGSPVESEVEHGIVKPLAQDQAPGSMTTDDGSNGPRTRCRCGAKNCRIWMPFDKTL